jgi:indole-3-glycerol phosphate synthase
MKAEAQERRVLAGLLADAGRRSEESRRHLDSWVRRCGDARPALDFAAALRGPAVAVIGEVKRRSPSAGAIVPAADVVRLAESYREGGAAAVSVLTQAAHFGGSLLDLERVAGRVGLPVLRKDFIVDEVQVYEARAVGASAVLLIARILPGQRLRSLVALTHELGMAALVEVFNREELAAALGSGSKVVGVNARDLDTLNMDPSRHLELVPEVPGGVVAVAESGITERDDVRRLAALGVDAVLVGTALAGASDPAAAVASLTGVPRVSRELTGGA